MLTIYGISNCDTVKKAKKWLESHDLPYQFHDYKKQGCSPDLVKEFARHFSIEQLINKRGTTWRSLSNAEQTNLEPANAVILMSSNPSLIKRPILHHKQRWLIGFSEDNYQQLINQ